MEVMLCSHMYIFIHTCVCTHVIEHTCTHTHAEEGWNLNPLQTPLQTFCGSKTSKGRDQISSMRR